MDPLQINIKKISLRRSYLIKTMDTEEHSIDIEKLNEGMNIVFENKSLILMTTYNIEASLESIIVRYFFNEKNAYNDFKRETFSNQVIKSNWCTFAAKWKLVSHFCSEYMSEKEIDPIKKLVYKAIDVRNAFVHGTITTQSDGFVTLSWFKEKPIHEVMDEKFIDETESTLKDCIEAIDKIDYILNPKKPGDYTIIIKRSYRNNSFPVKFWYTLGTNTTFVITNRNNGRGSSKTNSLDECLDFIGSTVEQLQNPEAWEKVKSDIKFLATSNKKHFIIGPANSIIDSY